MNSNSKTWRNKERVLVLGTRGISSRDRHLMEDFKTLMPHAKGDSKMDVKDTLFSLNQMAEMKNCKKVLLFQGKRKKDLYLWAASLPDGPSLHCQVENVHTTSELKMTGNCLKGSRPLLSFDPNFSSSHHWSIIKELFIQIWGVPNKHPKSQPFFDRVYTFSIQKDSKIAFRHYQIVEENGSLAEIGPRMILNPIKIIEGSFSGVTLWNNPHYVSPTAYRSQFKVLKGMKYAKSVDSKAAFEENRPKMPTYQTDVTDDVFKANTNEDEDEEEVEDGPPPKKKAKKKPKRKGKSIAVEF
ncbi:ribosome biogenesis protein BRX1 homolog [Lepeophtheirus salmonis]|nr:ribosome biogenesis protein BRX1 homolog [Lepeophtheirus salmonis]